MTDEDIVAAPVPAADEIKRYCDDCTPGLSCQFCEIPAAPGEATGEGQSLAELRAEFEAVATEWEMEARYKVAGTGWRRAHARCAARIRTVLAASTAGDDER